MRAYVSEHPLGLTLKAKRPTQIGKASIHWVYEYTQWIDTWLLRGSQFLSHKAVNVVFNYHYDWEVLFSMKALIKYCSVLRRCSFEGDALPKGCSLEETRYLWINVCSQRDILNETRGYYHFLHEGLCKVIKLAYSSLLEEKPFTSTSIKWYKHVEYTSRATNKAS